MNQPSNRSLGPSRFEQIKQIYDYTKYHIGSYFTLLTGLIAVATFGNGVGIGERQRTLILIITLVLLVAGIAGALVASRIVYGRGEQSIS
jgi:hypothetical protein